MREDQPWGCRTQGALLGATDRPEQATGQPSRLQGWLQPTAGGAAAAPTCPAAKPAAPAAEAGGTVEEEPAEATGQATSGWPQPTGCGRRATEHWSACAVRQVERLLQSWRSHRFAGQSHHACHCTCCGGFWREQRRPLSQSCLCWAAGQEEGAKQRVMLRWRPGRSAGRAPGSPL